MKLFTRQQVIDIWSKQSPNVRNSYVCPSCRDILIKYDSYYKCSNEECAYYDSPIQFEEVEECKV